MTWPINQSERIWIDWHQAADWPERRRRTTALRSTVTVSRQWRRFYHVDDAGLSDEEMHPCWRRPDADRRCCRRTDRPLSTACTTRPKNPKYLKQRTTSVVPSLRTQTVFNALHESNNAFYFLIQLTEKLTNLNEDMRNIVEVMLTLKSKKLCIG